jgi:hypothetical protein
MRTVYNVVNVWEAMCESCAAVARVKYYSYSDDRAKTEERKSCNDKGTG